MLRDLERWTALVVVVFATCHLMAGPFGQVRADQDEAETEAVKYLEAQMATLTDSLLPKLDDSADFSEQVDALAKGLDEATAKDPKLIESISRALHMEAIQHPPQNRRKRSLSDLMAESHAMNRANIVHAKHAANPLAILKQASNEFTRMGPFAYQDLMRSSMAVDMKRSNEVKKINYALSRIVSAIAQYGLKVLDCFYSPPEFVNRLPLIGEKLKLLREQGEPLYHLIEMLRHTANMRKLEYTDPDSQDSALHARRQSGEYTDVELERVSFTEEERRRKMAELKRLIGEAGIAAIKSIAKRLIISWGLVSLLGDKPANLEIDTRTFYMIITYVLNRKK